MDSLVCSTSKTSFEWLRSSLTSDCEEEFCYVTLKAGGKQFKVHATLISFHSQFLNRMFKTSMKEKEESSANFDEISSRTMGLVVDFIYASNVEINEENVMDLLEAANFLQIEELKDFCIKYFLATIDCSNCLNCYFAGVKYIAPLLSETAEIIIKENSLEIFGGKEFLSLEKDDVSTIIKFIDQTYSRCVIKALVDAIVLWVKYDFENRKSHVTDLIHLVKMHKLPQHFLNFLINDKGALKDILDEKYVKEMLFLKSSWGKEETKGYFITINNGEVKLFDVICLKWRNLPRLPGNGTGACALIHEQTLYVIGGNVIQILSLEDEMKNWCQVGTTAVKRNIGARAIYHDGVIIIAGGDTQVAEHLLPDIANKYLKNKHHRAMLHQPFPKGQNTRFYSCLEIPAFVTTDGLSTVETYDLKSGAQAKIASILYRSPLMLIKHNDLVYAVGPKSITKDFCNTTASTTSLEKYQGFIWRTIQNESKIVAKAAACLHEEIFCVGNEGARSYSFNFNEWRTRQGPKIGHFELFDILEVENNIFLLGKKETTYTLRRYNAMKESWTTVYEEDTGFACSFLSAT